MNEIPAGWRLVPEELADEMFRAARRAKIGKSNCDMCDWIEAASRQDLEDIGIPWYDHPYDRWSILNEELHELLLKTWWKAMLSVAPEPPASGIAAAEPAKRGSGSTDRQEPGPKGTP